MKKSIIQKIKLSGILPFLLISLISCAATKPSVQRAEDTADIKPEEKRIIPLCESDPDAYREFLDSVITVEGGGPAVSEFVSFDKAEDCFILAENNSAAPLLVSDEDYPAVAGTVFMLKKDISNVTGAEPEVIRDGSFSGGRAVIIGTAGKSPLIDELIYSGKIKASELSGKREKFIICTVEDPLPGIASALVITGSDRLGTIFGMYHLSENIGVSPWYWWADVPIRKNSCVYIKAGCYIMGEPRTRYRGMETDFENPDLKQRVYSTFGSFSNDFFEKFFELILRLKGNYCVLKGAGNPEAVSLAREYGIFTGTEDNENLTIIHESPETELPWLCSEQIELLWLKMNRGNTACENLLWLWNPKGIVHMEFLTDFWFAYVWDPEKINGDNIGDFYEKWAWEQFGAGHAGEIAALQKLSARYNSSFIQAKSATDIQNLRNDPEAERIYGEFQILKKRSEEILAMLPAEYESSFRKLVLGPAESGLSCAGDVFDIKPDSAYSGQPEAGAANSAGSQTNSGDYSDIIPASFVGFVEESGFISINASDYLKSVNSNGIYWQTIDNLGMSGAAVTPLPAGVPRREISDKSPRLEFPIYTFAGGKCMIHFYLFTFGPAENNDAAGFGFSVDDQPVEVFQAAGTRIITAEIDPGKPGPHIIKYWMLDSGIVLEKIVIDTGGHEKSYFGPPESLYIK